MRRATRLILVVTIALITTASLHFTIGNRFHGRGFVPYGPFGYGHRGDGHRSDGHRSDGHRSDGHRGYENCEKNGLEPKRQEGEARATPQPLNDSKDSF